MRTTMLTTLMACATIIGVPSAALAQKSERALVGTFGSTGGGVYECPAGQALVGLGQWRTDRVTGLSFACVKRKPVLGALWDGPEAVAFDPGGLKGVGVKPAGAINATTQCPYNFFMVGLAADTADYQQHPNDGLAHVDAPRRRVTDLQPVCRGPDGAVFTFPAGRLTVGLPLRSPAHVGGSLAAGCPTGFAAVGVHYAVQPATETAGLSAIALICDRVSHVPPPGATQH